MPLGNKAWFDGLGLTNVVEGAHNARHSWSAIPSAEQGYCLERADVALVADWWDTNELGSGVSIVCLPCQHFRYPAVI